MCGSGCYTEACTRKRGRGLRSPEVHSGAQIATMPSSWMSVVATAFSERERDK